jgi:hypothetical protein
MPNSCAKRLTTPAVTNFTYVGDVLGGHAAGGTVVETFRYIPEGSGFDSQWCYWTFSLT